MGLAQTEMLLTEVPYWQAQWHPFQVFRDKPRESHRQTVVNTAHFQVALEDFIVAGQSSLFAHGYTPSNFPEAGLTQAQLDELLEDLDSLSFRFDKGAIF